MEDNEYRQLWNDIRTKFFKNKELKEIKVILTINNLFFIALYKMNINHMFIYIYIYIYIYILILIFYILSFIVKIYNYIPYIINYSLKKENISNIFETKPEHFVRLLLEFVMDYLNENSLAFEQVK